MTHMRRVVGLVVLSAFAAGSGLGAKCFLSCVTVDRTAPAGCHEESASGPAVAGAESCPVDLLAAAPSAKRADVVSQSYAGVVEVAFHGFALGPTSATNQASDRPHGPPLTAFLIPLRL